MIRGLGDIQNAIDAGRFWQSTYFKNNCATNGSGNWTDWAYGSGCPVYDPHTGTPLAFTPSISGNDAKAIWFPATSAGQTRYLINHAWYSSLNGPNTAAIVYDQIGYYPFIDGTTTSTQTLDNTQPFPRYADGIGVRCFLVANMAPADTVGSGYITYVDDRGQTVNSPTFSVFINATSGAIVSGGVDNFGVSVKGGGYIPLASGSKGIKQVLSVTFTNPPDGLFALYIVKQVMTSYASYAGSAAWTYADIHNVRAYNFPVILDGAWLSFLHVSTNTATTANFFGTYTFVWG